MKFLLTFLFFVVTNICLSQTYKPKWILNDFNKAYVKALEEGKPLFIYFTSDGWSPYCEKLDKYILNTKDFKEWSDTSFVLLKLTYNYKISENPSEVEKTNESIKKDFQNMGYPIYGYPATMLIQPMICEELQVLVDMGYINDLHNPNEWIEIFNRLVSLNINND